MPSRPRLTSAIGCHRMTWGACISILPASLLRPIQLPGLSKASSVTGDPYAVHGLRLRLYLSVA